MYILCITYIRVGIWFWARFYSFTKSSERTAHNLGFLWVFLVFVLFSSHQINLLLESWLTPPLEKSEKKSLFSFCEYSIIFGALCACVWCICLQKEGMMTYFENLIFRKVHFSHFFFDRVLWSFLQMQHAIFRDTFDFLYIFIFHASREYF